MKTGIISLMLLFSLGTLYSETLNDPQAYTIYQQGNEQYKLKKHDEAKNYYLELINQYPESRYVPYSIYMLSFMETDYIKIIDYLSIIKEKYTDFRYWTNAVEKLGDVFYVMDNHVAAIDQYKSITTDRAYYMLALLYSANGFNDQAIENANKLLIQTKDNGLAYKSFLIEIKLYIDAAKFNEAYPLLQQAVKLKKWSFDNGARALFYSGKYYYFRTNVEKHLEKSLYVFSLLKTQYPLSIEATMANNYLDNLKKSNIVKTDPVRWIADNYSSLPEIPYQQQTITALEEAEKEAEDLSADAEGSSGTMVKSDFMEYVVRIGEYKDLSVANLVASDIVRSGQDFPLGVFYRNDLYYAEIRGIKKLQAARDYAKKMIALGYTETKILEVVKVVEYAK